MRYTNIAVSALLVASLVPSAAFAAPATSESVQQPAEEVLSLVAEVDETEAADSDKLVAEEAIDAKDGVAEDKVLDSLRVEPVERVTDEAEEPESELAADGAGEIEAFATRLYTLVLGRTPDSEGLANQVEGVKSWGAAQIAFNFFASDEYSVRVMSNEERVALVYAVMFDREPDATGMEMWLGYLENGKSELDIVAGFAESEEFRIQCAKWGVNPGDASTLRSQIAARGDNVYITNFVKRLYSLVLGRDPDLAGMNCQIEALRSGVSAGQIAANFFNSAEFTNRDLTNEERVEIAYNALLDRESEEAGLAYWTEGLDLQMTIEYVVAGFCNSTEFGNNCATWGVSPGSVDITLARNRSIDVTRAVSQVYEKALGRTADVDGLEHWCDVCFAEGYAQVCSGLLQSAEAAAKLSTGEQMASVIYQLCLGRAGSAANIAKWAEYFDNEGNPSALVADMSKSREYRSYCKSIGVPDTAMTYYDVSSNHSLNLKITDIILNKTGLDLYACFEYVSSFDYYRRDVWPSYDKWMEDYALRFIIDGGGNCYGYAAVFAYLARACGYDADVHQGTVVNRRGGLSNHGWTEIYLDGETYVCDPELYWELEVLCFMVSYDNAPFVYNR